VGINPGTLRLEDIQHAIRRRRVGRRIIFLPSVESTNDEAWRYLNEDAPDGLVVLAEHQTAGRGRFGRTWHSPRGASVLCSLLLLDEGAQLTGDQLGLIAALAARDAVIACTELRPTIKWPNDIVVGDRKLGGVLVESRAHHHGSRAYVVGMGINCLQQRPHFSAELGLHATSLEIESRLSVDRTPLAIALFDALDDWLAEPASWDSSQLRDRWLSAAQPLGKRVRVQQAGRTYEGSIIDVDPQAALLIMLDSGSIRAFNAGDTTVVWQESTASP